MIKRLIYYCLFILLSTGCKKFVTIAPTTAVDADVIFSGDEPANIALIGLYAKMVQEFGLMNGYPSLYGGQYADELQPLLPQPSDLPFFHNELTADERVVRGIWSTAYNQVNHANQTIEKIAQSEGMTEKGRRQLTAEAKFIRGIYYFYLINLFGEVPLILTSRYQETQQAKRMPITQVYQQIEQDLQEAVAGLPEAWPVYPITGAVPIRATKFAAMTLLARVHLYRGNWQQAIQQCDAVIDAKKFKLATEPNEVFRMSSPEIIFALQPTSKEYNTAEGHFFVYQPAIMPAGPAYVLTDSLVKAFEPTDKRFIAWAKPAMVENKRVYAPDKYEVYDGEQLIEVNLALRLAEVYLMRAEAYAQVDNTPLALADLNTIRQRAALPALNTVEDKPALLRAVQQERRIELFGEWGHRWLDLRRWPSQLYPSNPGRSRADDILGNFPGKIWAPWKTRWPIPASEIVKLPALAQNEGYD